MKNTNKVTDTLVRLPLYYDMSAEELDNVIEISKKFLGKL